MSDIFSVFAYTFLLEWSVDLFSPAMAGGCFFIKSQMNGLVMDVEGGGVHPGTKVVMWHQKHSDNDNQIFYEDPMTGTIRNKKSQLCLDLQGWSIYMTERKGETNQRRRSIYTSVRSGNVLGITGKWCSWVRISSATWWPTCAPS